MQLDSLGQDSLIVLECDREPDTPIDASVNEVRRFQYPSSSYLYPADSELASRAKVDMFNMVELADVFPGIERASSKIGGFARPPTSTIFLMMVVWFSCGLYVQPTVLELFWYVSTLSIHRFRADTCTDGSSPSGYVIVALQIGDVGNAIRSNRVTIPKLLPPPFSAVKRSLFSCALAVTIVLFAKTTSNAAMLSVAKPWRNRYKEQPPPSRRPPTPTLPMRPPRTPTLYSSSVR